MHLIVGLGNPGQKYQKNRHNVGFMVVNGLVAGERARWAFNAKFNAELASVKKENAEYLYVKPQTFMNNSGEAVTKLVSFYKLPLSEVIVINDDVDLPFGEVKKQTGSGSAGHNGVESIINHLGSKEFTRFRIGVGRPENPKISIEDWVLMDFETSELDKITELTANIAAQI